MQAGFPIGRFFLWGLCVPLIAGTAAVQAQVVPGGLGTLVNGSRSQGCSEGSCAITGGTDSGINRFHRLKSLDTRGLIQHVHIDSGNQKNIIMGVTAPVGSFINKSVELSSPAHLFLLSPGGIHLGAGAGFFNTPKLTLSTANQLRFAGGLFDVNTSTSDQLAPLIGDPMSGSHGLLNPNARHGSGELRGAGIYLDGIAIQISDDLLVDAPGGLVKVKDSSIDMIRSDGVGGSVTLSGERVQIDGASTVAARGSSGGGLIQLGGSWQNSNSKVRQSIQTSIDQDAVIDASALDEGSGGTIAVWSDTHNPNSLTTVRGVLRANGGLHSGNGGKIETSGYLLDISNASVDTSAFQGSAGTWLIDPYNIEIVSTATGAFSSPFRPTSTTQIGVDQINTALDSNSVTIYADPSPTAGTQAGTITFVAKTGGDTSPYVFSGSVNQRLKFVANSDIVLNQPVRIEDGQYLDFVSLNGGLSGTGGITLADGSSLVVDQAADTSFAGAIISNDANASLSSFEKKGSGTLTLTSNSHDFQGDAIYIWAGSLGSSKDNVMGSPAPEVYVSPGASLRLSGGTSVANSIQISGIGPGGIGALRSQSDANTITGQITLKGVGGGLADQDASIHIESGSLVLQRPDASASVITKGSDMNPVTNLKITGEGDLSINSPLDLRTDPVGPDDKDDSPMAGFKIDGKAAVTLNAASINAASNTDPFVVSLDGGGSLSLAVASSFRPDAEFKLDGSSKLVFGVLQSFNSNSKITIQGGGGVLSVPNSLDQTYLGVLAGSGSLGKEGGGTLRLTSAANTYSGNLTISAGQLYYNTTGGSPASVTCADAGSSSLCPAPAPAPAPRVQVEEPVEEEQPVVVEAQSTAEPVVDTPVVSESSESSEDVASNVSSTESSSTSSQDEADQVLSTISSQAPVEEVLAAPTLNETPGFSVTSTAVGLSDSLDTTSVQTSETSSSTAQSSQAATSTVETSEVSTNQVIASGGDATVQGVEVSLGESFALAGEADTPTSEPESGVASERTSSPASSSDGDPGESSTDRAESSAASTESDSDAASDASPDDAGSPDAAGSDTTIDQARPTTQTTARVQAQTIPDAEVAPRLADADAATTTQAVTTLNLPDLSGRKAPSVSEMQSSLRSIRASVQVRP